MSGCIKTVVWIGSSRKDLRTFPAPVRRDIGQALYTAQMGFTDPAAKPLKGFGSAKVMEIVDRHEGDTYRAVYTVQFGDYLYVLHTFKKKAKKGIATPQKDMELIRARLAEAQRDYQTRQDENEG